MRIKLSIPPVIFSPFMHLNAYYTLFLYKQSLIIRDFKFSNRTAFVISMQESIIFLFLIPISKISLILKEKPTGGLKNHV